jgi:hypothetical protein
MALWAAVLRMHASDRAAGSGCCRDCRDCACSAHHRSSYMSYKDRS